LTYIDIFTEVVLVLGFSIESVSWICSHFPLRPFGIVEFISDIVVRALGSLFSITIYNCHFFRYKLLGLSISRGCSKWKLWGRWFFAL